MELMGNIGQFYLVLLFLFLVGGVAVISVNLSRSFWDKTEKIMNDMGGKNLNRWLKLTVISFAVLIFASFALGMTNSISGQDTHSAHAGGTSYGGPHKAGYGIAQVSYQQGLVSLEAQLYWMEVNLSRIQQQLDGMLQANMYNHQANYGSFLNLP